MNLTLQLCTGEPKPISLAKRAQAEGVTVWFSNDKKTPLEVRLTPTGEIAEIIYGSDIFASTYEEICDAFINALAEIARSEAGGIEYADQALEAAANDDPFPYNPESIRVDTKPFNISLVYEMIKEGDINLSPDFQRQFVWTDLGTRSRLIESLMLRIPLPVFYLAQEPNGRFHVVDGLQRLTVIKQFLDNSLRLRSLEYLKEEEGKIFQSEDPKKCIDQRYRKRILQTQIMTNIIDPQTPSNVKFDIFRRINQGGRPLNAQEIRNCMSSPAARACLHQLASSEEFQRATLGSVGSVRMQDHELVLRFVAFRLSQMGQIPSYQGNMERFLDRATEQLNKDQKSFKMIDSDFRTSMLNNTHLFGEFAFRKCSLADLTPFARRRLMNTSLFTTWSVVLSDYNVEKVKSLSTGFFSSILAEELAKDPILYDAVSVGTNDVRRLNYAFTKARDICREHLP